MSLSKENIANWFESLQDDICRELEQVENTTTFYEDKWKRKGGGGGKSRIIKDGETFAKGGVNFSAVEGKTPEKILLALQLDQADFFATGVSIVIHPVNPFVPIIHMNVRYFEMSNGIYWFGGGIDLTPHYIIQDDATFFHRALKKVCDTHDSSYYPQFKKWADDYFFLKHRNETRGIGGIFFDRLSTTPSKEKLFSFVKDVGKTFAPTYVSLVKKNRQTPYSQDHLYWQSLRRSRYVEFNLLFDKGTKFGLDTDGRTESILMSMPPMAKWEYAHVPRENSEEALTLSLLKKGIDWVKVI